jgi:hypothetical protein
MAAAILRYYLRLFRRLPSIFRKKAEAWTFWVGVVLGFLGFFSPEIEDTAVRFGSRWWALLPIGLLILWGLLKANYDELERASSPGESKAFTPPLPRFPMGYYVHKLQKEEREAFEQMKKDLKRKDEEIAALKRQLGLPH